MFRKMFKKEEYKEAYLKVDKDKVIKKEKRGREEIGEETGRENDTQVYVQDTPSNDGKKENEENDKSSAEPTAKDESPEDSYSLSSNKENPQYRSFKSMGLLIFWILLFLSAMLFFGPYLKSTFQSKINYNPDNQDDNFASKLLVSEKEDSDDEENDKNSDKTKKEESDSGEVDYIDEKDEKDNDSKPESKDTGKKDVGLIKEEVTLKDQIDSLNEGNQTSNDTSLIYSDIHASIIQNTEKLRDEVQKYVTGMSTHINMSSAGGRVNINLQGLTMKLNKTPDGPIKELLIKRLDRVSSTSKAMQRYTEENASEEFNTFLKEENQDSKDFITLLVEVLEEEGKSYRIEEGIIYFK